MAKPDDVIYVRGAQKLRARIRKYIEFRKSRGVSLSLNQATLQLLDEALTQQGIK